MLSNLGKLQFITRQSSVDQWVLTEEYQQQRFFADGYRPTGSDVILDIGAHIGVFSIMAGALNPDGKVYAIECFEENYSLLKRNVDINRAGNVLACHLAIAGWSGTASICLSDENWGHSITRAVQARDSLFPTVKAMTLGDFVRKQKLGNIDYVKMNVEGAEYGILLSCPPEILRIMQRALIEFHPDPTYNEQMLIEWLKECGFNTNCTYAPDDPHKGWISAELAL